MYSKMLPLRQTLAWMTGSDTVILNALGAKASGAMISQVSPEEFSSAYQNGKATVTLSVTCRRIP